MSDLILKIKDELTEAQKAKDEVRVSTLRMLLSAFKNKEIELGRELNDAETLEVVAKNGKQHKESIDAFEAAGRNDLAGREREELEVLKKYLPELMSSEEITKVVDEVLAQGGERDMGRVMSLVMARIKGKADGSEVSRIVGAKLKG